MEKSQTLNALHQATAVSVIQIHHVLMSSFGHNGMEMYMVQG